MSNPNMAVVPEGSWFLLSESACKEGAVLNLS